MDAAANRTLDLTLLGGFEAACGGVRLNLPTRHCGFLLAMLALSPGQRLARNVAAGRLWSERGDAQARASLRQTIYHLQRALKEAGVAPLRVDRDGIAFEEGAVASDVGRLRAALASDPAAIPELYAGELLASCGRTDPEFETWLMAERTSLRSDVSTALHELSRTQTRDARHAELQRTAETLLKLDPFDETALRAQLAALAGQGRRGTMLAAYRSFAEMLDAELGTEPEPATRAAVENLSHHAEPGPAPEPEAPPDAPLHEERRNVSVITLAPAGGAQDPETARDLLVALAAAAREVVEAAGGRLAEPMGGTVTCVFGLGDRAETHAEDAVRSAWRLSQDTAIRPARLGVSGGEVIVSGSAADPASLGLLTAEAAGLSGGAADGVRISQAIAQRVDGFFDLSPLPDGGFQVLAPTRARSRWQAQADQRFGAFVSREAELAELQRALSRALQGDGRIVSIVGEAGIGKSRLVEEFLHTPQAAQCRTLTLAAAARDANTPFGPLGAFLREWLGGADLPARMSEEGIATRHAPPLRDMLGLPAGDPEWEQCEGRERRRAVIGAMRAIIAAASAVFPLILVAEDLHWLDGETELLLDAIVDDMALQPVLLIATSRPEYAPRWVGRSFFQMLRLDALPERDAAMLLSSVLGSDPRTGDLKARIVERTSGVPLFIEETIKALIGSGALSGRHGAYLPAAAEISFDVPATIRDVLTARIASLDAPARWLLQTAAVFGIEAPEALLRECNELGAEAYDAAMGVLRRSDLLLRVGQGGGAAYMFRHALVHDVAYQSLLRADRQRLHGWIFAAMLERTRDVRREEAYGLAHHSWHAGDMDSAALWFRRVGDMFTEISAYSQAADAYLHALEAEGGRAHPEAANEVDLRLRLRPVLVPQGRFRAAIGHLEAAEKLLAGRQDGLAQASVQISKSYLHSTCGRLREAVSAARRAGELAAGRGQLAQEACLALGQALSLAGEWRETIEVLTPTLAFWEENRLERFGHTGTRSVWCHGHLAHSHAIHGDFEAGFAHAARAGGIAAETRRPLDRVFADHRRGEVLLLAGRSAEAVDVLEGATRRAEEEAEDAPIFQTWFACDLAPAYLALGRVEAAAEVLEAQAENARSLELRQFGAWIDLRLGEVALARGDRGGAAGITAEVIETARGIGDAVLEPAALRLLGAASGKAGREFAQEALALARARGLEPEAAACGRLLDALG